MAGLSLNLQTAQAAVDYVRRRLPRGAGNVAEDVLSSGGASARCVTLLRASYPDSITFGDQSDSWVKNVADAAAAAGCGNCAEQCAVAIVFLWEYAFDSVDLMAFDPQFFDHQFVAIGRAKGSVVNRIATWGPDAVICNPWQPLVSAANVCTGDRRAYAAREAMTKMPPFLPAGEPYLMSLARWEV